MDNYLKFLKTNVNNLKDSYVLVNPTKIYENYRFKIDELETSLISLTKDLTFNQHKLLKEYNERINLKIKEKLYYCSNKLAINSGKLDGLSPLKVLKRGYAFATVNNKVIKEVNDVNVNETIKLSLQDGNINALVISKEAK
jgi:exodeoxyribonuclease VII large subunit